jgi:hypothetical protein
MRRGGRRAGAAHPVVTVAALYGAGWPSDSARSPARCSCSCTDLLGAEDPATEPHVEAHRRGLVESPRRGAVPVDPGRRGRSGLARPDPVLRAWEDRCPRARPPAASVPNPSPRLGVAGLVQERRDVGIWVRVHARVDRRAPSLRSLNGSPPLSLTPAEGFPYPGA